MFAGSVRSALIEGVKNRDWAAVENAAGQLLAIWPNEPSAQVGMALAFEATGRAERAGQYSTSLSHVTAEHLWLGIQFVKNRIRRHDFDGAERDLAVLSHRFGFDQRVVIVQAQMAAGRGNAEKAVELCERVLTDRSTRDAEAFHAGLILRDENRLDILVNNIEKTRLAGIRNSGLLRLYTLGCVINNVDPLEGLGILSDLWDSAPNDGFVVADYATALRLSNRSQDAKLALEKGLQDVPVNSRGRRALLEAYADLLEAQGSFAKAFEVYRNLLSTWSSYIHIHRKFASCLLRAAGLYRGDGDSAREEAAAGETVQVF